MKISLNKTQLSEMKKEISRTNIQPVTQKTFNNESLNNLRREQYKNHIKVAEWNFKSGQLVIIKQNSDHYQLIARNIMDNQTVTLTEGEIFTVLDKETFRNYFTSSSATHSEMIICFGNHMYLMIHPALLTTIN
jgi:hypothetical protein